MKIRAPWRLRLVKAKTEIPKNQTLVYGHNIAVLHTKQTKGRKIYTTEVQGMDFSVLMHPRSDVCVCVKLITGRLWLHDCAVMYYTVTGVQPLLWVQHLLTVFYITNVGNAMLEHRFKRTELV
jgi:hypothetical protein